MAYPITDIQGIGADDAAILKSDGIRTTIGLLRIGQNAEAAAEDRGENRRSREERARLGHRRRPHAGQRRRLGICRAAARRRRRTVNELKFRNPQKLVEAMAEANTKRKLVRLLPSVKMVGAGSRAPRSCRPSSAIERLAGLCAQARSPHGLTARASAQRIAEIGRLEPPSTGD